MKVCAMLDTRNNTKFYDHSPFIDAFLLCFCVLMPFAGAGCAKNEAFGVPKLQHDPQNVQIRRATRFDPYPDPNIGPEIHGARPYGFDDPSTERIVPTKFPQH